jgi:hypothetical protein
MSRRDVKVFCTRCNDQVYTAEPTEEDQHLRKSPVCNCVHGLPGLRAMTGLTAVRNASLLYTIEAVCRRMVRLEQTFAQGMLYVLEKDGPGVLRRRLEAMAGATEGLEKP